MRTGPRYIQSAHRTAIIAGFFVSIVLLLVLFGFVMGSGDEFTGAGEPLAFSPIPVWLDVLAPHAVLKLSLGGSIFILCLVFKGGHTYRTLFRDRTIGSAETQFNRVFFVAAPYRAVIIFLRPTLSAGRY
jgi:hypothetical protein